MLAPSASMNDRLAMYNGNALKIGLFGANCSSGRSATKVPERWSASWPECLALARLADEAGLDFMLPIARWKGYGGDTDFHGHSLETITWAVGLLGATKRMTVFGTVHAPLFHPLIAAKEFVTADHIGEGRVGVNIVCGWNEGEFDMFGVTLREHDQRYDYAQEWIDVVKAAWERDGSFDFAGAFFKLDAVRAYPKPYGGTRPMMMNAGSSGAGQAFALRNCDAFFVASPRHAQIARRQRRQGQGSERRGAGHRPRHRSVHRRPGDLPADAERGRGLLSARQYRERRLGRDRRHAGEQVASRRRPFRPRNTRRSAAISPPPSVGGYPFVGTPDRIAEELTIISQAGVRGIGLSFVNYLAEVPYFCDEVLPRLQRAGVRVKN